MPFDYYYYYGLPVNRMVFYRNAKCQTNISCIYSWSRCVLCFPDDSRCSPSRFQPHFFCFYRMGNLSIGFMQENRVKTISLQSKQRKKMSRRSQVRFELRHLKLDKTQNYVFNSICMFLYSCHAYLMITCFLTLKLKSMVGAKYDMIHMKDQGYTL